MVFRWGVFSRKSARALEIGWIVTAALVAFYLGFVEPTQRYRGIASERSAGLAATARWKPASFWRQSSMFATKATADEGVVGGVPGGASRVRNAAMMTYLATPGGGGGGSVEDVSDRKLIRTAALALVVKSPSESTEQIVQLAHRANGYLVSSQVDGLSYAPTASLSIRVPAEKFEETRNALRKLALRVESDSIEAQDATRQYVDQEARLRNLRAEEQQYLGILRKSATVKDTLEVSEKLNEVRGAIEERQAEFEALSKQVQTVAINITLRAEADTQVFGLHWRPLYQLKIAARDGLDGLGEYASSMAGIIFRIPSILLWMLTIVAGASIGWNVLRRLVRIFFPRSRPALTPEAPSQ